jgi:hypothetical protein
MSARNVTYTQMHSQCLAKYIVSLPYSPNSLTSYTYVALTMPDPGYLVLAAEHHIGSDVCSDTTRKTVADRAQHMHPTPLFSLIQACQTKAEDFDTPAMPTQRRSLMLDYQR